MSTIGILFTLIVIMLSRKVIIGNKVLNFIGKISLEVYLIQGIFNYVFNKLFSFILSKYKKLIAR